MPRGAWNSPIKIVFKVIGFCYKQVRKKPTPMPRGAVPLLPMTTPFPSLRQLRSFEAVARLESVSAAAREIGRSQPSVTQAIRALEKCVDAALFERRRSGCYVTDLGAVLLPRVQRFCERLRSALSDFGAGAAARQGIDATVNRITRPQLRSLIAISENPSFD